MYYYREAGKKIYTLNPSVCGKFVERAHPAPFTPTDTFSKYRISIKRRYSIYPFGISKPAKHTSGGQSCESASLLRTPMKSPAGEPAEQGPSYVAIFVPMRRKDLFSLSTLSPSQLLADIQNKRHFEPLLRDLKNNVPDSTIFLHKVSKKDAPTYYDVIKNPMDLGTMNKKLPLYDTRSFCDDLDLIWENCFYFNKGSPFFVGCAERMKARAESLKSFYFGDENAMQWAQFRELTRPRRIGRQRRTGASSADVSCSKDEPCTEIQHDILSRSVVRVCIARILKTTGFSFCTKSTLDTLADVFIFYMLKRVASLLSAEPREC